MIFNGINGVVFQKVCDQHGKLCHMCFSLNSAPPGRTDLVSANEGIQIACLNLEANKKFKPHKHLWRPRTFEITQEAWIVVRGTVNVTYFDEHGESLGNAVLEGGDISITLRGGHGYEVLDDAEIYEMKLGPFSAVNDKEYLG